MITKRLSRARFDLFAIGTRLSPTELVADQFSYWSDLDENVIGVVFRDRVDNGFGWALGPEGAPTATGTRGLNGRSFRGDLRRSGALSLSD